MKAKALFMLLMMTLAFVPTVALATLKVGDPAPDFNIPDTAGVNHHLTEWRGKVVVMLFWQQW